MRASTQQWARREGRGSSEEHNKEFFNHLHNPTTPKWHQKTQAHCHTHTKYHFSLTCYLRYGAKAANFPLFGSFSDTNHTNHETWLWHNDSSVRIISLHYALILQISYSIGVTYQETHDSPSWTHTKYHIQYSQDTIVPIVYDTRQNLKHVWLWGRIKWSLSIHACKYIVSSKFK